VVILGELGKRLRGLSLYELLKVPVHASGAFALDILSLEIAQMIRISFSYVK
jgi:hypothetical protein